MKLNKKIAALSALAIAAPAFATVTVDSANRHVLYQNTPNDNSDFYLVTSGNYTKTLTDSGGSESTFTQATASQNADIFPLSFGGNGTPSSKPTSARPPAPRPILFSASTSPSMQTTPGPPAANSPAKATAPKASPAFNFTPATTI